MRKLALQKRRGYQQLIFPLSWPFRHTAKKLSFVHIIVLKERVSMSSERYDLKVSRILKIRY